MKIRQGDTIDELSLPAIDGSVFDLESVKGSKMPVSYTHLTLPTTNSV